MVGNTNYGKNWLPPSERVMTTANIYCISTLCPCLAYVIAPHEYCYQSHFTDEETEAQSTSVNGPEPHS